jgi:ribonucleoside-diphosphate reductase alpha chain
MECTNPCGEVPLIPFECCNLGSINLSALALQPSELQPFDWDRLAQLISVAIRFLDNVIEVNQYLLPETREMAMGNRKIGLGVMGWADALGKLLIPYGSNEAIRLANKLMHFIQEKSFAASVELAKQRGTFLNWQKSIFYPATPIRNATRTSIAPTGSISILANTSPSIEPWFALAFERSHVLNDETLIDLNPVFQDYLERNVRSPDQVLQTVRSTGSTLETALPARVKDVFKTALEIDPQWHLQHQLAFQKYTDNAVSKTINLTERTSVKDISSIFFQAWKNGLKGITVFRENSKKPLMKRGTDTAVACKICS